MDLAGVRVALYFPADKERVEKFLKDSFIIVEEKYFPAPNDATKGNEKKNKFDGYYAQHYRIKLKEETLTDTKYANSVIEIQVASILMHAWSEVNHDLAYKPSSGELSQQELSILDGLNGLVLTGEVLLEQLQIASHDRVAQQTKPFANQYELATFVSERLKQSRSEVIFKIREEFGLLLVTLSELSQDTPDYVDDLLKNIDTDIYGFSISHQIFLVIFERNINNFDIFYNLMIDYDCEIQNRDFVKQDMKKILVKLIFFKRYIRYLVSLYNIKYSLLFEQICILSEFFHVTFLNIPYMYMFMQRIYDCVYRKLEIKIV